MSGADAFDLLGLVVGVGALDHVALADDLQVPALLRVGGFEPLGPLTKGEDRMPGGRLFVDGGGKIELGPSHTARRRGVADALPHPPFEHKPLPFRLFRVPLGSRRTWFGDRRAVERRRCSRHHLFASLGRQQRVWKALRGR